MRVQADVVVVGGGNAGLVAAITALESGHSVLLVEKASRDDRGGNSKYTRDFRFAHGPGVLGIEDEYSESEFLDDLIRVTRGQTNVDLAKMVVGNSLGVVRWAEAHGVRWQRPLPSTLHLGRTNAFVLGGGKALVNRYYRIVEGHPRATVMYGSEVVDVELAGRSFRSIVVRRGGEEMRVSGERLVLSSGGFESNLDVLREYWGEAADHIIVRGTHNDTGLPLLSMVKAGAGAVGRGDDGHMVAVDARSPRFNGGIVTRVDSVPFGIVLNSAGLRFYDEGEDLWPKRYAIWGKLVARQPGHVAFSIFDSESLGRFIPPFMPPVRAESLEDLVDELSHHGLLDPGRALETVREYNAACRADARPDYSRLDGLSTVGLEIPKSNWAKPLRSPPFYAYVLRPGLTFTYMSLRVGRDARVLDSSGRPFDNVYAAGEIMAGNVLTNGYLGGLGLVIGTVFGILAGGGEL